MSNDRAIFSVHYSGQRLINPLQRCFSESHFAEMAFYGNGFPRVAMDSCDNYTAGWEASSKQEPQNLGPTSLSPRTRMDIIAPYFDTEQAPGTKV